MATAVVILMIIILVFLKQLYVNVSYFLCLNDCFKNWK